MRQNVMIEQDEQVSELFRKYLYRELDAPEVDTLEDRLFADSAFAEQLEDFENDLVDSYIRGDLSVREKDEFENRYLVSESHREKTTVARILHDKMLVGTRPHARVAEGSKHGFWTAVVHAWQNRGMALTGGLAAAVLVGMLGTWLYFRVADDRLAKSGNVNAIVDTNESQGNSVNDDNSNPESAQNGDRNDTGRSPEPSLPVSPPTPANQADTRRDQKRVFAFTLLPVTRSANRPVIEVPATADTVMLTLVHDDQREFRIFKVELKSNGGEVAWKRDVRPSRRKGSSSVVVGIPAAVLRSGNYEIGLAGVTQDAVVEDLKFYQFSVKK